MAIDLSNIEQFVENTIRLNNPEFDTREGTAFRDLLIKPLSLILQPFADEIEQIQLEQSIINADAISSSAMDALVANAFVSRRQGASSTGSVRLFFTEAQSVTVQTGTIFISEGGQEFATLQDFSFTREAMLANRQGNLFYIDVVVFSTDLTTVQNIDENEIVDVSGGPAGVASVTNPSPFTGGVAEETNRELADRSRLAITVRDLNTEPAIRFILLENFPTIRSVQPIGFGDPEMNRDLLNGTNLSLGDLNFSNASGIHIGGKTDIYFNTVSLTTDVATVESIQATIALRPFDATTDPATPGEISYADINRPIIVIDSVKVVDPVTFEDTGQELVEGTDWVFVSNKPTFTYSVDEDNELQLLSPTRDVGKTIQITYKYPPEVAQVQSFIESPTNRITNADLLARHGLAGLVDMDVVYEDNPDIPVTESEIETAIITAISSLKFGDRLEVSDIIKALYNAGAVYVQTPITVTITTREVDASKTILTTQDRITLPRTVALIPNDINVTKG